MFLMVQCYDALGDLYVRAHMVDDGPNGVPMTTVLRLAVQAHRPDAIRTPRDTLAWLGEELIDLAHQDSPLL